MARLRLCRWNCGRKTDRICGICIYCCDERDRKIAAGKPYIPPSERPGHRFYQRKREVSESQKAGSSQSSGKHLERGAGLKMSPKAGIAPGFLRSV
jgi:hypothetical protein